MTANSPPPSSRIIRPKVATYQIVSRSRSRTSRCISSRDDVASVTKTVSGAAHGLNQLDRIFVVDLTSQSTNQDLEHIREWIVILVPDVGGNRGTIHYLSGMKDEKLEQRKFFRGELDWPSGSSHALRFEVDFEIGHMEGLRQRSTASPREGPDPRQ